MIFSFIIHQLALRAPIPFLNTHQSYVNVCLALFKYESFCSKISYFCLVSSLRNDECQFLLQIEKELKIALRISKYNQVGVKDENQEGLKSRKLRVNECI